VHCWWKCKNGVAAVENGSMTLQKATLGVTIDLIILPLVIFPKELKAGAQTNSCPQMFIATLSQ
jgi:hypothetical protein